MCYNCGCHIPDYDMGNPDNITNSTFETIAAKWKKDKIFVQKKLLEELKNGLVETPEFITMFEKASHSWGQTADEAQAKTLKLLERRMQ